MRETDPELRREILADAEHTRRREDARIWAEPAEVIQADPLLIHTPSGPTDEDDEPEGLDARAFDGAAYEVGDLVATLKGPGWRWVLGKLTASPDWIPQDAFDDKLEEGFVSANLEGAVTSDMIDSLETAKLEGFLPPELFAAKSILASALTVANFDNIVADGSFEAGAGDWTLSANASVSMTSPRAGLQHLLVTAAEEQLSAPVECADGDRFYAEAWSRRSADGTGAGTQARVGLRWYNAAGAVISTTFGAGGNVQVTYSTTGVRTVSGQAPAGAAAVRVVLDIETLDATSVRWDSVYGRRRFGAELIVDGSITANLLAATMTISSLIRTATSGRRLEMDEDGFRVYDASNNVIVRFPTSGTDPNLFQGKVVASEGVDIEAAVTLDFEGTADEGNRVSWRNGGDLTSWIAGGRIGGNWNWMRALARPGSTGAMSSIEALTADLSNRARVMAVTTGNQATVRVYAAGWDTVVIDQNGDSELANAAGVPSVTALPFNTGWGNFGSPYSNCGYYRDRGRVYLRGVAVRSSGTSFMIGTLPSGFRPPAQVIVPCSVFGAIGEVSIATNGQITVNNSYGTPNALTVLEGVSFRA